MLRIVGLGGCLLALTGLGYVATGCAAGRVRPARLERLAAGFLLGSGLLSLFILWVSLAAPRTGLRSATVAISLTLLIASVRGKWRQEGNRQPIAMLLDRLPGPGTRGGSQLTRLLLAVLGSLIVATACGAFTSNLGWDGLAIWGLKAKAVYLQGGVPFSHFGDASRQWSHLDYPLLVPLVEGWVYSVLGRVDETLVKGLFLAFFLSLLALFYSAMRRRHSHPYSLLFTVLLCLVPSVYPAAISGYADLPLSAFAFGSSAYLYLWLEQQRATDLQFAGVLSALAMWTKREGAVIWLLNLGAVALWLLVRRREPARKRLEAAIRFLFPLVLVSPWLVYSACQRLPTNDFGPLTPATIVANACRLPVLARLLLANLASVRLWGVLWFLFALSILSPSLRGLSAGECYLFASTSAYVLLLTASFTFSLWQPYSAHVAAALPRLVLHVAPTALFFVAIRTARFGALPAGWLLIQRLLPLPAEMWRNATAPTGSESTPPATACGARRGAGAVM